MLKNYYTSIWRYISRNPSFTIINFSGLVIGMMACMLIGQYVLYELSYDSFHEKKDSLYRLQLDRYNQGEVTTQWAAGCLGIGPDLKDNFPEVEKYAILTKSNATVRRGDVVFKEDNVFYASEDFFTMFSIPLIKGIDTEVLKEPFRMVISESFASKYFGDQDPIGKTLNNRGGTDYEVTGVFKDLPANTHMQIDALLSFASWMALVEPDIPLSWQWDGFFTYLELTKEVDYKEFESKLPSFVQEREGEELQRWDADMVFNLQPVSDIHLDSDFMMEFKANGDRQSTYFLSIVAALILIIAWINFVNLSTAKSIDRAREVGIRKVMGGHKGQLIRQFLFESVFFNTIAILAAVGLAYVLTPWFGGLTGRDIDYLLFRELNFWLALIFVIAVGAVLSGIYPAMVLSSYQPGEVLKGKFGNSGKGLALRKGMVILQFITSITLIVGTYTVYTQIQFMRNQELGVDIDQTVVIQGPDVIDSTYQQKFEVFKQRVGQYSEVSNICGSSAVPGEQPGWNAGGIRLLTEGEEDANQYRVIMMDHDYIPSYGLEVVAGRGFSGELSNEHQNVMLNESGSRLLGFEDDSKVLENYIYFWGDTFKVIGVVKDYHHESLRMDFEPLVFRYSRSPGGFYSVKFNTSNVQESLSRFEDEWDELFAGNPFTFFFLDDHYDQQYKADQQFGQVFGLFSALAIFIACLGLFGLSSLTVVQRTKEIGIRKALGANISQILALISRSYMLLMAAAIIFSIPLAWWIMSNWLNDFAYRIELAWWIFLIPCFGVMVIAFLTIGIHTLRAASIDPVHTLRSE